MANEGDNQEGAPTPEQDVSEDTNKNMKMEFNRKLQDLNQNLTAQNAQLQQQLQAIMQTIDSRKQAGQSTAGAEKKLEELMYDNPTEFVNQVKRSVKSEVRDEVFSEMNQSNSFNQAATQLDAEFPEFRDRNSEQRKRVEAYYAQLPEKMRNTKEGLEVAVYRAAAEFGLIPASKRSKNSDEYSMSGSSSNPAPRKPSKKAGEMAADQAAFAELIGAPVNDPKFKAEFEKATGRNYGKFK